MLSELLSERVVVDAMGGGGAPEGSGSFQRDPSGLRSGGLAPSGRRWVIIARVVSIDQLFSHLDISICNSVSNYEASVINLNVR